MTYDFTTRMDKRGEGAIKWDSMFKHKPDVALGVVPLSVADMEFPVAPPIVEALQEFVSRASLGYTVPTEAYYEAVLSWQERCHGWKPEREWLCTSPGVVPAFYAAVRVLTKPGDGVIVQTPVYYPFMGAVKSAGMRIVENPLVEGEGLHYEMDFDDLERKAADPANTVLLLCSPHNPVGRVWTAEELHRVLDICMAHDVFVISDEIHDDLIMPGSTHTTLLTLAKPEERERIMVCTAPSKTFSLAGCQCSNIYIPSEEVRTAFQGEFGKLGMMGLNAFAFQACTAAYTKCDEWLEELLGVVWGNWCLMRDFCAERLPEVRVTPLEGTYLAWVDCRAWGRGKVELEALMREHDLFLDEGYLFGTQGEGFERINLACPCEVLHEALLRFEAAAKSIR